MGNKQKNIGIISVSLKQQQIEQINKQMQISGVKSRSKIIARAINEFCESQKSIQNITNEDTVVFMISHGHLHKSNATSVVSGYEEIVRTILHHHSKEGCLDILIVQGDCGQVKQLYKKICTMKEIDTVKISVL